MFIYFSIFMQSNLFRLHWLYLTVCIKEKTYSLTYYITLDNFKSFKFIYMEYK